MQCIRPAPFLRAAEETQPLTKLTLYEETVQCEWPPGMKTGAATFIPASPTVLGALTGVSIFGDDFSDHGEAGIGSLQSGMVLDGEVERPHVPP
jgi:hypothetical protein